MFSKRLFLLKIYLVSYFELKVILVKPIENAFRMRKRRLVETDDPKRTHLEKDRIRSVELGMRVQRSAKTDAWILELR